MPGPTDDCDTLETLFLGLANFLPHVRFSEFLFFVFRRVGARHDPYGRRVGTRRRIGARHDPYGGFGT
jgi:hypothetical protein